MCNSIVVSPLHPVLYLPSLYKLGQKISSPVTCSSKIMFLQVAGIRFSRSLNFGSKRQKLDELHAALSPATPAEDHFQGPPLRKASGPVAEPTLAGEHAAYRRDKADSEHPDAGKDGTLGDKLKGKPEKVQSRAANVYKHSLWIHDFPCSTELTSLAPGSAPHLPPPMRCHSL